MFGLQRKLILEKWITVDISKAKKLNIQFLFYQNN